MPYPAKAVANYLLDLANDAPISPMKMQKLVYYAHGWHLAITDEPLIDEQIEAWKYGPVIRSLFHKLKHYGNSPIPHPIIEVKEIIKAGDFPNWKILHSTPALDDYPDGSLDLSKEILRKVWDEYGGYSAFRLSNMTHEPGGPWDKVMSEYGYEPPKGTDIPRQYIKEHFQDSLQRHLGAQ